VRVEANDVGAAVRRKPKREESFREQHALRIVVSPRQRRPWAISTTGFVTQRWLCVVLEDCALEHITHCARQFITCRLKAQPEIADAIRVVSEQCSAHDAALQLLRRSRLLRLGYRKAVGYLGE
jgi:hypothetical protein